MAKYSFHIRFESEVNLDREYVADYIADALSSIGGYCPPDYEIFELAPANIQIKAGGKWLNYED